MNTSRGQHPLAAHTSEQLSRPPIPDAGLGRRGYDKPAVDMVVADLAEYIDALRVELAGALRVQRYRELEIEQRRYGIRLPSTGQGELVHEEQLTWHLEAQRYGDQITAAAQVQAGQIVHDAQQYGDQIRAAASSSGRDADQLQLALRGMRQLLEQLARHVEAAEDSERPQS
jgi:hypothetical protein